MKINKDILSRRIEQLQRTLSSAGDVQRKVWIEEMEDRLASLEQAVREHTADAEAPDGLFAEIDLTRPSLTRRVQELRQEHRDFVDHIDALREEARRLARPLASDAEPQPASSGDTMLGESALADACQTFRRHTEDFIVRLQEHEKIEADLVLESVDTDIGVGD